MCTLRLALCALSCSSYSEMELVLVTRLWFEVSNVGRRAG